MGEGDLMAAATEATAQPQGSAEAPWPSPVVAWYAVFVFALSLFVNFMDRGIINLLVQPIEHDLHLSDLQFGMTSGLAFAFFYAMLGLPIARLVDSKSRRAIVGVGLAIWGLATSACGLARSFGQLFAFRVGVGVGEACTGPATFSMLADFFPKHRLGRAIAAMNFGFIVGNGLALIAGGAVIAALTHAAPWRLPVIGTMRAWQEVFFIVGVPGFVVALLMMTVPEPARRGRLALAPGEAPPASIPVREVLAFLRTHWKAYAPMFGGLGLHTILTFGAAVWTPAFYIRHFGWSAPHYAYVQGLITLIISPLGAMFGAWLAERWARQGHNDANMRVVVACTAIAIPGAILFPLMPSANLAIVIGAFNTFVSCWVLGPQNAAIQVITPNQMRGQVTALFLFIFNVVGFALGPVVVASITTFVFHSQAEIGYSLATAAAFFGPAALIVLIWGLKHYGEAFALSRDWI
jgi:MFS family permease